MKKNNVNLEKLQFFEVTLKMSFSRCPKFIALILFTAASLCHAYTQEELLQKLYENNAEIIKAESDYTQASLDLKDAKGGLGPVIDLQISGTYMVNPPIGEISVSTQDVINLFSNEGYTLPPIPFERSLVVYEGMEHTLYNFSLSLTQPIFTWGKLTNAVKLYEQVKEIRLLQKNDLIRKKEAELFSRLTAIHYLSQIDSLLDEQSLYAKRLVEISDAYAKNGLLLNQDVLNAKMQAQEIDIAKKNLEREKEIQKIEIQKLLSDEIDFSDLDFAPDEKKLRRFLSYSLSEIEESSSAAENNQIKILNALIETSRLAKNIADASVYWKPDVALQSSVGYAGQRFPFIQDEWDDYGKYSLNFSLGLRTTVWDGGKALRNVQRKEDELNLALSRYSDSVLQLKMAGATSYSDLHLAESRCQYQKLLIENDGLSINRYESEYRAGFGTEMDVLKAKIKKITDTISLLQMQIEMYSACFTLDYLCGEGM